MQGTGARPSIPSRRLDQALTMKILLTGIGGDIGQAVAGILREHDSGLHLVGTDIHERHAGKLYVDEYMTIPRADNDNFLESFHSLLTKASIEVVIPLTEAELAQLPEMRAGFEHLGWISPGSKVVETGIDKLKTSLALADAGIEMPWTVVADTAMPKDYPCIFKSRFGSGSRNIYRVANVDEARFFVRRHPQGIFQELLTPENKEVTCAVYRTRDDNVHVLQLLRQLSGGLTSWAKVISDPETRQLCHQVAEYLDLRGSMNIQLRITDKGPQVFEINPRFSSTALMRHRAGFSDVIWSLMEINGKPVVYEPVPLDTLLLKKFDAVVEKPMS